MLKNLKKMLNYDQGGQIPGQPDSNDQSGVGTPQEQPGVASQASQSGGAQSGASSQQSANAPARTGTGFTNIQKYIGANTNNQLGGAVGGGIQNTAQQAGQDIQNAQNSFNQQSGAANQNTQANRDYIAGTYKGLEKQAGVPDAPGAVNPSAGSNPNYAPTQQDTDKFKGFNSGQYTGPQQMDNQQGLQTQAQDVSNLGHSINSFEGRQGLLQRFVGGNKNYTQGQQNLDSLLLGQTGGKQLAQARQASHQMPDLNNLLQANTGAAETYQNQAKDLAGYTQAGAKTSAGNIQKSLSDQATAAEGLASAKRGDLQKHLEAGALTEQDSSIIKNILGLNPDEPIYGTREQIMSAITGALQKGNEYTASSVANQPAYASQQALQKLSGLNPEALGLNLDASKIGTGGTDFNVDQTVKQQLLDNQQQAKDKFYSDYKDTGNLSREELDYMNSGDIQNQFGKIGGMLNQYGTWGNGTSTPTDPGEALAYNENLRTQEQAAAKALGEEQASLRAKLAAFDTQGGQKGFERYNSAFNQGSLGLGQYGGKRTQHMGEGVSALLANVRAQQQQREDLEKSSNRFGNLSELLASKPAGSKPSAS